MRVLTIALALCLAGCGSTRSTSATNDRARQEDLQVDCSITVPGVGVIPITLTLRRVVNDHATSEATAKTAINAPELAALIGAAIKAAGVGGGISTGGLLPIGGGLLTMAAAAATGYLQKRRQVDDLKADIEYHKADAAEGWAKAIPKDDAT